MRKIHLPLLLAVALLASSCAVSVETRPITLRLQGGPVPVAKDDCKRGGWRELRTEDGRAFENQGDCVSYVARR